VFGAWADGRAIRQILGGSARIEERTELRRREEARTQALRLAGDPSWYVLKTYRRAKDARREAENLTAVQQVSGLAAPHFHGLAGTRLVRRFVAGATLRALERDHGFEHCLDSYAAAVDMLVRIHAARDAVARRIRPRAPFERPALAGRLRRTLARIQRVGLPQFAARTGPLPQGWSAFGWEDLAGRLVEDLSTEPADAVLGHGDFCAANLVLEPSGGLVVIDWDQLSLATPWRDLGRLLRGVPARHQSELASRYLGAAQRSGLLSDVRESRALALVESGILYDCLAVARIAAGSLRARRDPRDGEEFREVMERVVEGPGFA